jgi:hypothetical protein
MPPVVYRNTQTTLPGWVNTVHESEPRGFAYETDTHFVHFYGRDSGIWVLSTGLTATQAKQGTLANWVTTTFGAQGIAPSTRIPGQTIAGVWRPGISNYDDIRQGLSTTDSQRHAALQTVRLLLERLDDLFLYIEPSAASLATYSHKTRELLILACTEVENAWKQYMREAIHTKVCLTGRFTQFRNFRILSLARRKLSSSPGIVGTASCSSTCIRRGPFVVIKGQRARRLDCLYMLNLNDSSRELLGLVRIVQPVLDWHFERSIERVSHCTLVGILTSFDPAITRTVGCSEHS